jgi:hypothetical protein
VLVTTQMFSRTSSGESRKKASFELAFFPRLNSRTPREKSSKFDERSYPKWPANGFHALAPNAESCDRHYHYREMSAWCLLLVTGLDQ